MVPRGFHWKPSVCERSFDFCSEVRVNIAAAQFGQHAAAVVRIDAQHASDGCRGFVATLEPDKSDSTAYKAVGDVR